MAGGGDHLIERRKGAGKIKSIMAMANEESDSMHDEVTQNPGGRILRETLG